MITLYAASCRNLSLGDAQAKCAVLGGDFHSLVMDRAKCVFAGAGTDLSGVYEARFFGTAWELRWLREGMAGRAAILSESPIAPQAGWEPQDLHGLHIFDDELLLWGKVARQSAYGWTELRESRIGTITVPVAAAEEGQRIAITQRSYFTSRAEDDGNLMFAASRYLGFACIDAPKLNVKVT